MNWVAFVGEGRSGHTLLSGILGSHPNARISEEQKYISKWLRGWTVDMIRSSILQDGAGRARTAQGWKNLRTHIEPLSLIGDKCGWDAVNEYRKRGAPISILSDFQLFIDMPVKVVVTVRHPADNIANWVLSNKYSRIFPHEPTRQHNMIKRYRRFYSASNEIIQGTDHFVLYHEELLKDPSRTIEELRSFVGLPSNEDWLKSCLSIIHPKPNVHRNKVEWTIASEKKLKQIIDVNPLMAYYRGDSFADS